jgi:DNA-binding CsgD family transcriptional regulator
MARGRKSSLIILLSTERRTALEAWQRRPTLAAGLARRARMVLLRAEGHSLAEIARRVGVAVRVVAKWLQRYRQHGLHGLGDKHRPGRPPVFSPQGGPPCRQTGLRTPRHHWAEPLAVG